MMLHNIARQDRPDDEDAKPSPADRSGVASMQEERKREKKRAPAPLLVLSPTKVGERDTKQTGKTSIPGAIAGGRQG
jgi:hypothetical protein